jgi:hypothetical protein
MYSLAALLSIVVAAAFVLGVVRGRRRHLVTLAASAVAVLYTHTWGVFLVAGLAVAWLALWHAGRAGGREGVLVGAAVALAYAPWVPSLLFQALHTAAPWAERPPLLYLLGVPGALFGYVAAPILVAAALRAGRDATTQPPADAPPRDDALPLRSSPDASRRDDDALRPLLVAAASGVALAWACAQLQPAWSPRYLAVFFGPLLLWLVVRLARGGRGTVVALAVVGLAWAAGEPTAARSNVGTAVTGLGVRAVDADPAAARAAARRAGAAGHAGRQVVRSAVEPSSARPHAGVARRPPSRPPPALRRPDGPPGATLPQRRPRGALRGARPPPPPGAGIASRPRRPTAAGGEGVDLREQRGRRAGAASGGEQRERATLTFERGGQRRVARDARLELGAAARAQAVVGERDEIGLVGRMECERRGHPLLPRTPTRRRHSTNLRGLTPLGGWLRVWSCGGPSAVGSTRGP